MLAFIGDLGVLAGIVASLCIYFGQANASKMRQLDTTLAALHAAKDGVDQVWGPQHFETSYTDEVATMRSRMDAAAIVGHGYSMNFCVPTEPIASLIHHAGDKWQIRAKTVEAANKALWRIGTFNQIVQMQTEFNALHFPEVLDDDIDDKRREAIAKAASTISYILHANTIGEEPWYREYMDAIAENVALIERLRKRHWWSHPQGTGTVVVTVDRTRST